ncbi:MAG: acyl transferase [Bacteroidetes bacterium]|nr:acyl transferase [Bacteroidota bacterium]
MIKQGLNDNKSLISFEERAITLFKKQYSENAVYRDFVNALGIDAGNVTTLENIPFLPVSFFKTHHVVTGNEQPKLIFESSATTGEVTSKHYVIDENVYINSLLAGFEQFYGPPSQYAILALLPSYLERKNASLVHMAKVLMQYSGHPDNGFYLDEWGKLAATIQKLESQQQPAILLGVTFALLDFADKHPMHLKCTIVMETGGMKGRKEEMTRTEVHDLLKKQWGLKAIHSEYGMTELLSQAYAKAEGIFYPSDTMKVLIRDMNDPLEIKQLGSGLINIIDLANINSCAFIATDDIGNIMPDGGFEVLGRADHSALRGCSLMTA